MHWNCTGTLEIRERAPFDTGLPPNKEAKIRRWGGGEFCIPRKVPLCCWNHYCSHYFFGYHSVVKPQSFTQHILLICLPRRYKSVKKSWFIAAFALYDFSDTLLFKQIKRYPIALKMLWKLQHQIFRPNMIWLVSYKSGYSLFPTYQENKNKSEIKRKLSANVRCFTCANYLLAIQDNNVPTGLLKYDESPSEII